MRQPNMQQMMKQVQKMQADMAAAQEALKNEVIDVTAGGGVVKIAIGGGINDLITVGGNLTLDGTLNVIALPGYGAGYYRLISYDGGFTNNGLDIGTVPGGYSYALITGIAGQVNLLANDGTQLIQYWDGTDMIGASAAANGNGGAGIWNATNTN